MIYHFEMRPTYESKSDLENEAVFQRYILDRGYTAVKLAAQFYQVDWIFLKDNKIVRFAEFKRRQVNSSTYPDIILSLHKWEALLLWGKYKPSAFFVTFNDKTMFIKATNNHGYKIALAGRRDRGDKQDIEPCIHLPITDFKVWEK